MRRTEQLKLFDSSKSVVVAIDNKLPSLDASNLYNLPNSSLGGLLFKAPKIDSETITYNLYIEFSADGTFATTTTYNTTDASHRNLFKVFSGQQLTDFPESGISLPFSNEVVSFDITELNKELKYFRFRWNNGSDFGGYGFGKTDSLLQIFDSGSSLDKVSVGIGLSGDGSESNPLNVDLSSYETTAGISIQGLNIDLISDGNFDIKGTALNIGDNTTNIPIVLNGHTQNSASGLVVLGEDGKLPALDGSKLTNVSSIISVSSGLVGNGTTANPIKLDLSSYSTTDKINIISAGFDLNAGNNNIDFTISEGSNRFRILVGDQAGSYNQECMFDVSQPQILLNAMGESVIDLKVPSINKLRLSIADRGSECVPNTANGFVIVDQDGKLPALDGSKLTNLPAGGLTTVTVSSGLSGSGTSSDPIKLDLSNYNSGSNIILNPGSNMITLGSSNSAIKLSVSGTDRLYLQQGDGTQSACNTANGLVVLGADGKIPTNLYDAGSSGSSLTKLSFKVPEIPSSEVYHFTIEFSSTLDFASTTIFKTNVTDDLTKFKVSTGIEITDFPSSGLGVAFIGETVFFDFSSVNESLKYFRYRWSDSGNNYSGYGFGQTDSLLQIFGTEEGSGSTSIVVGNGLTGEGNTANPLKVDLSNFEQTLDVNISSIQENITFIADNGNVQFNGGGNQLILDHNGLSYNNHYAGEPESIVLLDSNGKLPAVDGSQLTNLPTGGLSSVSVGSGLTGNGTSSSPIELNLDNYDANTDISITAPTIKLLGGNIQFGSGAGNKIYLLYEKNSPDSSVYLNNNKLNTAGGLVEIGTDGKIPESLYNSGSSSEITEVKPLLIELNGSNSTSDGITVTYDNENHIVTIVHNLNSYVNGILFDEYGKQALLGIDFVDLNTVSIQFTSQIMPTSESIWKLYLGTQNYNYVYSNAVQTKTISTKDIVFDPNKSIYVIDVTENTLITFDKSNLNIDENIYTFEIWVKMTNAYTIGFSGDIEWLDEPDLTAGGFYCFVVRFMPTSYYPMSLGDRDAIMSLSYHI